MMLAQNLNEIGNNAGLGGVPSDIGGITTKLIPYAYYAAGFLLLIYMIMGGYQIMFSKGDPKGTAAGWSKISSAIIGFLIVILSYALTLLVGEIFGLNIFSTIFRGTGSPGGGFN